MRVNGSGTLADMSAHTFYASSSHIWPLFPPAASGVWASGAGGWLWCSAVAQDHACLFGHGPAPESTWGSVPVCSDPTWQG